MGELRHPSIAFKSTLLLLAVSGNAFAGIPTIDEACNLFSGKLAEYSANLLKINHPEVLQESILANAPLISGQVTSNPAPMAETLQNCRRAHHEVRSLWMTLAQSSRESCQRISGELDMNAIKTPIIPGEREGLLKQYSYHTSPSTGIHHDIQSSNSTGSLQRLYDNCIGPIPDRDEAKKIALATSKLSHGYEDASKQLESAVSDAIFALSQEGQTITNNASIENHSMTDSSSSSSSSTSTAKSTPTLVNKAAEVITAAASPGGALTAAIGGTPTTAATTAPPAALAAATPALPPAPSTAASGPRQTVPAPKVATTPTTIAPPRTDPATPSSTTTTTTTTVTTTTNHSTTSTANQTPVNHGPGPGAATPSQQTNPATTPVVTNTSPSAGSDDVYSPPGTPPSQQPNNGNPAPTTVATQTSATPTTPFPATNATPSTDDSSALAAALLNLQTTTHPPRRRVK